ncbi:MAG TPA: glycosyltransferase [Solirubrobacteraceae bacterium]|jgi:glycosyltransferase involved in cell wall biosynthesis
MSPGAPVDVLIVSLGSTAGLRAADEQLRASLARAGASVVIATAAPPRQMRTLMLTDLAWAMAARSVAARALTASSPRAIVYSSTTAALLWPRPGAIRFDAPAAGNRPGRHGLWQRPLERHRLAHAPLLLPWSEGGLAEARGRGAGSQSRELVVPVAVGPSGEPAPVRDVAAITYAANPAKKGLDRVLAAWRRAGADADIGELLIAGSSAEELRRAGFAGDLDGKGVRVLGPLAPPEYRALLRRSRLFVCAPRREDYGIAQLEALADGCRLLTTPTPGPYAALPIARELDTRLVTEDLAAALAVALHEPDEGYGARARLALAPFAPEALDRLVAGELLPRLLA